MLDYPFSDASTSCYRGGTPLGYGPPFTLRSLRKAMAKFNHRLTWIPRYSMPLTTALQYLHGFRLNSGNALSQTNWIHLSGIVWIFMYALEIHRREDVVILPALELRFI